MDPIYVGVHQATESVDSKQQTEILTVGIKDHSRTGFQMSFPPNGKYAGRENYSDLSGPWRWGWKTFGTAGFDPIAPRKFFSGGFAVGIWILNRKPCNVLVRSRVRYRPQTRCFRMRNPCHGIVRKDHKNQTHQESRYAPQILFALHHA